MSEWRDALVQCFSTPPPPLLYTDSYQIYHCVWMKGCSSAVLLNPPPPLLYTDSYQIFHCVWMKGCSSAVLLNPPPSSTLIHIRSSTVSEWRDALVQCFSSSPPPPPLLYTDSYQIFHCVWMKGCSSAVLLNPPPSSTLIHIRSSTVSEWRDALVQCFSTPPPSPPPLHWFISDLPLCLNEGML